MKKSTSIIIFILCLSFLFLGVLKTISANIDKDPTPVITLPADQTNGPIKMPSKELEDDELNDD